MDFYSWCVNKLLQLVKTLFDKFEKYTRQNKVLRLKNKLPRWNTCLHGHV
jgi:hypothetical protein